MPTVGANAPPCLNMSWFLWCRSSIASSSVSRMSLTSSGSVPSTTSRTPLPRNGSSTCLASSSRTSRPSRRAFSLNPTSVLMISGRLSARSFSERVVSLIIERDSFMPKEAIRMQAVPPPTMKRAGMEMIPAIVPPFRIIPMMMKTQAPTRPMRGDIRADSER